MPTITNNMQETCQVIFFFARTKTVSHDPHTQMPYVQPIFPLPGFTRSSFMAPALVRFGFTDAGCNASGVPGEFIVTGNGQTAAHTDKIKSGQIVLKKPQLPWK